MRRSGRELRRRCRAAASGCGRGRGCGASPRCWRAAGSRWGRGDRLRGGARRGWPRQAGHPAPVRCRSPQAAAYGRCVAAAAGGTAELRRDTCLEEFQALRDCFARAVRAGGRWGWPGGSAAPGARPQARLFAGESDAEVTAGPVPEPPGPRTGLETPRTNKNLPDATRFVRKGQDEGRGVAAGRAPGPGSAPRAEQPWDGAAPGSRIRDRDHPPSAPAWKEPPLMHPRRFTARHGATSSSLPPHSHGRPQFPAPCELQLGSAVTFPTAAAGTRRRCRPRGGSSPGESREGSPRLDAAAQPQLFHPHNVP